MVRLEVFPRISPDKDDNGFNSYMVRLEESDFCARVARSKGFQFLYGAIGRKTQKGNRFLELGFNSYMVRLEVPVAARRRYAKRSFNSYMVRLEGR